MARQIISLNRVHLIGTLGRDIEVRTTNSGKEVGSFSLATNFSVKNGDSYEQYTDWHSITVWDGNSNVKALKKGDVVFVSGKIRYETYEKDGKKIYTTKIIADEIYLQKKAQAEPQEAPKGDDLPF